MANSQSGQRQKGARCGASNEIRKLLEGDDGPHLYVSGTVSNQGRFYERFDAVVLLSAPANVLLTRIETRSTNAYGKTAAQRECAAPMALAVDTDDGDFTEWSETEGGYVWREQRNTEAAGG